MLRRRTSSLGLILWMLAITGCAGEYATDDFDEAYVEQDIAIPGRWALPASVHAVAQTQSVPYDGAPPWNGGANCSGTFLGGTRIVGDYLKREFSGVSSYQGYSCRPNTANPSRLSIHGTGRAIDVFIPLSGGDADNTQGDQVANWLITHAERIGIQLVIWDRSVWQASLSGEKLRAYGGPVPHIDHLHVELIIAASRQQTAWFHDGGPNQRPDVGVGPDGCSQDQRSACGNFGCACVNGGCSGGFCPGTGCTALETQSCNGVGTQCVDHQCSGGFAPGSGCTALETQSCNSVGAQCVDHQCSGGFASGSGCTALETQSCNSVGAQCVDHQCSGGFAPGSGCTALETQNCNSVGAQCVDHQCSGGFAPGSGCTALETQNCNSVGAQCVDHQCSGGFAPGSGCTALETQNCGAVGCGCVDHGCNGGFCPGNGCTVREQTACQDRGGTCLNHVCQNALP
jgi:hypothetical protein